MAAKQAMLQKVAPLSGHCGLQANMRSQSKQVDVVGREGGGVALGSQQKGVCLHGCPHVQKSSKSGC